jgi:hypothetical protein
MTPIQYALTFPPQPEHEVRITELLCEAIALIERSLCLLDQAEDMDKELSPSTRALRQEAVKLRFLRYTAPNPF